MKILNFNRGCKAVSILSAKALIVLSLLFSTITAGLAGSSYTATWLRQADPLPVPYGTGYGAWNDMFYDSATKKTVLLFGVAGKYANHVWHYGLATDSWFEIEPFVACDDIAGFTPPYPRDEQASDYDALNNLYWSVGGSGYKCKSRYPAHIAGDGSDTTTIVAPDLLDSGIASYEDWTVEANGRLAFVSAYDPVTGLVTLATPIRGLTAGMNYIIHPQRGGGTWYYSPIANTWGSFEGPHWGYAGEQPTNRFSPAFAYSTVDQAFLMFGGGPLNFADTWLLDAQTKTWLKVIDDADLNAPAGRAEVGNSMVYDKHNNVFILFGGMCADPKLNRCDRGVSLGDTWVYDIATNTWTEMYPTVSPSARERHSLVYDEVNQITLLFGGRTCAVKGCADGILLNDVWAYDYATNTWSAIPSDSDPQPVPRFLAAMAFDPTTSTSVVFSGKTNVAVGDIWTLQVVPTGFTNLPPVADFNVTPLSGTVLSSFQFDASISTDDNGISLYSWDFGDGNTASGISQNHVFDTAGVYDVSLTVQDTQGVIDSKTFPVSVALAAAPTISLPTATVTLTVDDPTVTQLIVNGEPVFVTNGAVELPLTIDSTVKTYSIDGTNGNNSTTTRTLTIRFE